MLTKDQAIDKLMHTPKNQLFELVRDSHYDQYMTYGHHMYSYTVPEMVSWYILHYCWNTPKQCWESVMPMMEMAS